MAGRDGDDLIIEEVKISSKRTSHRLCSRSEASLRNSLGDNMQSAKEEIEQAYSLELDGHGYPSIAGHIDKIKSTSSDQVNDWVVDRLRLLKEWRSGLSDKHRGITMDICLFGYSARQVAEQRDVSHITVMKYLKEALNDWCILSGKGNQLN